MKESYNIYDLLSKIDWEGGITSVLEYGVRDIDEYDVPEELKEAWAEMSEAYADFEVIETTVLELLNKTENTYNEEKGF